MNARVWGWMQAVVRNQSNISEAKPSSSREGDPNIEKKNVGKLSELYSPQNLET